MQQKVFEFLSSFGMMLVGVILLFLGSVSISCVDYKNLTLKFPCSGPRVMPIVVVPPPAPLLPMRKTKVDFDGKLSAVSALVVDDKTNAVLYQKNTSTVRSLASITKLMSALVLLDSSIDWSTTTVITEADWDSSSHHINVGEKFTAEDLWNIALVGSSNSAINTLVRIAGFSRDEFVAQMNTKAQQLKLTSLRFADPTGLDNRNMGKASDVAKLLKLALEKEKIIKTLQIKEYQAHPIGVKKQRQVWSTNWLLTHWIPSDYKSTQIVGKTGYIGDSGYNFTMRVIDAAGRTLRVVVLGTASNEARFTEARDLAQWAFANYLWPDQDGYELIGK